MTKPIKIIPSKYHNFLLTKWAKFINKKRPTKRNISYQEEFFFKQFTGGVVWQRVREQGLDDQDEVDQGLETGLEVVNDLLAGVLHEGQEADVAEQGLEDGSGHVRPGIDKVC